MRVLVAYATAGGSTREVAERIGARLAAAGHDVEVVAVDAADGVERFGAAVVGSAVHGQAWLPQAMEFVRTNGPALARVPVWAFSVGAPAALPRPLRRLGALEEAKLSSELRRHLSVSGERLFSGVLQKRQFTPLSRLIVRLLGGSYGDFRDWEAIDRWAGDIARALEATDTTRLAG